MSERRWTERRPAYLGGRVYFHQGTASRECIVRNISNGGVLLEMESVAGVPPEFELHLLERRQRMQATRVWRTWNRIGVSFVQETGPAEVVSLAAARIRELEKENETLKARLAAQREDRE